MSFPFTELPYDLQKHVCGFLHVEDRARLRASLPRGVIRRILPHTPAVEKKLGILAKAVRKRRVSRLSGIMLDFLRAACCQSDPTVRELAAVFPEVATIAGDGSRQKTIAEKISDGTITVN